MLLVKLISEDKRTIFKNSFDDNSTYHDLVEFCKQKFQKELHEFEFVFGYPPKILKGRLLDTLISLGLSNGEAITLRSNAQKSAMYLKLKEFGYSPTISLQAVEIEVSDVDLAIEICQQIQYLENGSAVQPSIVMRKVIDADNSCLFNSIAFLLSTSLTSALTPLHYRNIVATAILSDPNAYLSNMVDESRSPEEYAQWILEPSKWGGEIEMSILALQLQVEIAAVDIQTTMMFIYGEGMGFSQRLYLLYDGIHYDALVMAPSSVGDGGASPLLKSTDSCQCEKSFLPSDVTVQEGMKQYATTLNANKKFISLSGCDLKCNICGVGLKGQSGAVEHAKLTGHTNFGQI